MTNFFVRIGHAAKVVGKETAHVAVPVAAALLPLALPDVTVLHLASGAVTTALLNLHTGAETMNPLEQFAISIIFGVLNTVVKNPAHAAALKTQLLGLADDIYQTYGHTAPALPGA